MYVYIVYQTDMWGFIEKEIAVCNSLKKAFDIAVQSSIDGDFNWQGDFNHLLYDLRNQIGIKKIKLNEIITN